MTRYANSLVIFNVPGNGNTMRHIGDVRYADVADCTQALAETPPKQWMRRASLLLARAVHALEAGGGASDALSDLDRVDALSKDHADAFYQRSLGLDVELVRAYALRVSGDHADAAALAHHIVAERPFSRAASSAALLAVAFDAPAADVDALIKSQVKFSPAGLNLLYQRDLSDGRYAEAMALYPQLVPPRAFDQFRSAAEQVEDNRARAELSWATWGGERAYALAALGRGAEAEAALDAAKTRLAKAVEPPADPIGEERSTQKTSRILTINTNRQIAAVAQPVLDQWATLVELRLMVLNGHADDAIKALPAKRPIRSWAAAELFDAIAASTPSQAAGAAGAAQALRAQLKAGQDVPLQDLRAIWSNLPEAETRDRTPPYAPGGTPLLAFNSQIKNQMNLQGQGYRSLPAGQPGVVAVRYRGLKGTLAMIEEMAVLRAAELALEAGKKGFIILDQRNISFTLTRTMYARPLRTDPTGFETEINVVFVDPAMLPAPFSDAPWRVIDAEDVIARLKPIYVASSANPVAKAE
jgi:hypothetical protein